jgi:hypothetical protein
MSEAVPVFNIPDTVKIVFFVQDGEECWSIYKEDIEKCQRRGYPYRVVEYTKTKS